MSNTSTLTITVDGSNKEYRLDVNDIINIDYKEGLFHYTIIIELRTRNKPIKLETHYLNDYYKVLRAWHQAIEALGVKEIELDA